VGFGVLALLFLWPLVLRPTLIPFAPAAQFSDLLITHLPNAAYVRDSLARYGQWPLWNAQIFAGQPFAADPLAGMWYPPNLLLLLPGLPLPLAFNLLFVLHFAWAGVGMFYLLRDEGVGAGPAFLGALAFMGTPKLAAHLGAGHASLVFAAAWTPWLLLAIGRAARGGGLRRGALAGAGLALLLLADVRWAFYAALLGAAYWLWRLRAQQRRPGAAVAPALAFAAIFLMLTAVLTLPLVEFVLHSNRRALTIQEAAAFSLPPRYLLGLLIPDLGGFHEWMTYVSVIPLLLALAGVQCRTLFWPVVALAAIAFSLGTNSPLFPWLYRLLPGLAFLRVPPRAWFVAALGLCALAAHGAQRLIDDGLPFLARRYPRLLAPLSFILHPSSLIFVFSLLTLADLLRVDSTLLTARPAPDRAPAAEWIAAQPGLFRVYSPSYSLPLGDGLQHVDGVDPLQLAAFVKFAEAAAGVKARGYSVTVPAFESDDLAAANASAKPDVEKLGLLNVKYVAAEFPLDAPELTLAQTFGRTRVYENTAARPRAWVEGQTIAPADVGEWSPNRITIHARGPGLLVLGEAAYPGWEARVDGVVAPIETRYDLLRGVRLPEGAHTIVFEFRPRALAFGGSLTLAGLLAFVLIWRWDRSP
jgi:hypothetical protein